MGAAAPESKRIAIQSTIVKNTELFFCERLIIESYRGVFSYKEMHKMLMQCDFSQYEVLKWEYW